MTIKKIESKDTQYLFYRAVLAFRQLACDLLVEKEMAVVGICGGRSISDFLGFLSRDHGIPWNRFQFFMLDERLVPLESGDSNYGNLKTVFFDNMVDGGFLERRQIHPFEFDEGHETEALSSYYKSLQRFGGYFDIILISSGEDGHIASLFPNHASICDENEGYIIVNDSPKPPSRRISASRKLIQKSKSGLLFFTGEAKSKALKLFHDDRSNYKDCPAKLAIDLQGLYVFTDLSMEKNS
ncbi:MAG: 6-phosphogluconolactonase [Oligoflexales bacterium]|nr:6-phosphogluconolactonase [Oligoflexales bacterium]